MPSSTGVKRRRGDVDAHLAGTGDGLLDVLVAQHVGVAVVVKPHCLHHGLACLVGWGCFDVDSTTIEQAARPPSRVSDEFVRFWCGRYHPLSCRANAATLT